MFKSTTTPVHLASWFTGLEGRAEKERERESATPMKSSGGQNDKWWQIVLQVFPTYLMAGCGMVGAGLLLDYVQGESCSTPCQR